MTYLEKFITILEAEEGYLEKATNSQLDNKTANAGYNNYTKYSRDTFNGLYQAQPWCAGFITWGASKAGISTSIIPAHVSCSVGVSWFKSKGRWKDKAGYIPKRGDIVYFSSSTYPNGGAHVGAVTGCDGKTVYTTEGNTSGGSTLISNGGGVFKKSYTLGYDKIYGYASPDYPDSTTGTSSAASTSENTLNLSVGDIVDYTGTTHYTSANATTGTTCKPGKAKITDIVKGAKHPYHLVKEASGSTVYGWVDAADIGFAVGDKVKVKAGAKEYNGGSLAAYVYTTVYEVLQVSGDRAVIGLNGKITAPVKVEDLIRQ